MFRENSTSTISASTAMPVDPRHLTILPEMTNMGILTSTNSLLRPMKSRVRKQPLRPAQSRPLVKTANNALLVSQSLQIILNRRLWA